MHQKIQTWLGAVILILFAITSLVFVKIIDSRNPWPEDPKPSLIRKPRPIGNACTMEAKLCPDGQTSVGRTGPKCEFELCPGSESLKSIDSKWDLYINQRLGFSMKVPKSVYDFESNQLVPLEILENGNFVLLTSKSRYEYQESKDVLNKPGSDIRKSAGVPFMIAVRSVKSPAELDKFIRDRYGKTCRAGEQTPSKRPGTLDVQVDAPDMEGCPINFGVIIKYSPAKGLAAIWDVGQDRIFSSSEKFDDSPDQVINESFEFLP